jgi:hypothetical protein
MLVGIVYRRATEISSRKALALSESVAGFERAIKCLERRRATGADSRALHRQLSV